MKIYISFYHLHQIGRDIFVHVVKRSPLSNQIELNFIQLFCSLYGVIICYPAIHVTETIKEE